ncbi:Gfo/Idh/MocA family oxidoreductase [Actinoallomurus iriomotensis]|uniref:Gfo/Idh/MocA family oxidoreductase n=1 Tax=Actinoallomurus iriomotensis TaxID=478107 RepID=UPI0025564ECB|nr:Gfo/Idh/MocA family oxidoreductase [Actinoallomurus iriomotensis]
MRPKVRVALIGLGRMGRVHARNLAGRCRSAELAAVADADAGMAEAAGAEFDVPWTTDSGALLDDPTVDAVAVATPTAAHADLVVRAARAGKHVFCEKPIALDRPATVRAVEAVAATGVRFQIGFHRRHDPDWVAATRRIHAGEMGEPYLFRTSLRDMKPPPVEFLAGSGGFFVDMTIHDLDTARWMVGEVVEVAAYGTALADPAIGEIGDLDTALVVLRFESGALGVIDNSRAAGYGYECSTEVMGRSATVRIDRPQHRHYQWLTPDGATYGINRDFEERYPLAYAEEMEAFARCVRDGTEPAVTGLDALAAFDLATAADLAWRTGRAVPVVPERRDGGVVYSFAGQA